MIAPIRLFGPCAALRTVLDTQSGAKSPKLHLSVLISKLHAFLAWMYEQITFGTRFCLTRFAFICFFALINQRLAFVIRAEDHMLICVDYKGMCEPDVLVKNLRREDLFAQSFGAFLCATVVQAFDFVHISAVEL